MRELASEYAMAYPGIALDIETGSYNALVAQATQDNGNYFLTNHLPPDSPLWAAPVGQDGIAMILHPDNAIQALTSEQVRGIYQGFIGNWDGLGAAEGNIQVVSREDGSATRYEFERLLMGNRPPLPNALVAPTTAAMTQMVQVTPNSIGYVAVGQLSAEIRAVAVDGINPTQGNVANNTYPLRSTLYIVGVGEPPPAERAFIGWVQGVEGQRVVARWHVPLFNPAEAPR
jgi:phosphate transport system substrate-binding protein